MVQATSRLIAFLPVTLSDWMYLLSPLDEMPVTPGPCIKSVAGACYRRGAVSGGFEKYVLYKLLVFGHRSLAKNIKQTAVTNILKHAFLNLTFHMLVDIHFQKYNSRYKFLESYLYCNNGGLGPRQKNICNRKLRRFKQFVCKETHWKGFLNKVTAGISNQCWL